MRRRTLTLLLILSALALAAAGCGGGDSDSSGDNQAGGSEGGTTLELAADPGGAFSFDKTSLEAPAGKVTIALTNDSSIPHNVTIEGNGIEEVASDTVTGASSDVTADLEAGTYTFYCSVDGHEAAGMKGTLTVK